MTLPLAKTPVIAIVCLVVLALVILSLALASHWLVPTTHLPAAQGIIVHPWCGGSAPC
jgi:hypothetical protein